MRIRHMNHLPSDFLPVERQITQTRTARIKTANLVIGKAHYDIKTNVVLILLCTFCSLLCDNKGVTKSIWNISMLGDKSLMAGSLNLLLSGLMVNWLIWRRMTWLWSCSREPRGITRICSATLFNKGALTMWNCRRSNPGSPQRWDFRVTKNEIKALKSVFTLCISFLL